MVMESRYINPLSLDSYRTNLSAMKNERAEGRKEGEAIGMQKGRAEGHTEAILSTAKKMKGMGLELDIISHATGLSIEEIEKL